MKRFVLAGWLLLLVGVLAAFTFPQLASAQAAPGNLANGEDVLSALKAFKSGTFTPGEAKITAQVYYWQQKEAGASDEVATAAANAEVPASDYAGSSGALSDLWEGITSLAADGSEAVASAGELLDLAEGAGGVAAIGSDVAGTCVGTAGVGCAAAVVVGAGAVAYTLLNGGSNAGSSSPLCDGGVCETYDEVVKNVTRGWYSQIGGVCAGNTSNPGVTWHVNFDGWDDGTLPCTIPGVFYATISGNAAGGGSWGGTTATRIDLFSTPGLPGPGDFQPCGWTPGSISPEILDINDNGLPKFTQIAWDGTGGDGLTAASKLTTHSWDFVPGSTGGTCPQNRYGHFEQMPSQLQVSFPSTQGCQGISCTGTVPVAASPTLSDLISRLGDGTMSDANHAMTSILGGKDPSGNPVALPGSVTMPDCTGLSVSSCQSQLSAAGITGTVTGTQGDCSVQTSSSTPGHVVSQSPGAGVSVDSGSSLAVVTAPSPACIPLPTPTTTETATDYENELIKIGFSNVQIVTLSPTNENPNVGPNGVSDVYDQPRGQIVGPNTLLEPSDSLQIRANPSDAPAPGAAGTGISSPPGAPAPPGITIPTAPTPCTVFPFGIPCWIGSQLGMLNASPVAPSWSLHLPQLVGGGLWTIDLGGSIFGANLSDMMAIIRPILLLASFVGLMIWIGGMALGGSTGSGGSQEAED